MKTVYGIIFIALLVLAGPVSAAYNVYIVSGVGPSPGGSWSGGNPDIFIPDTNNAQLYETDLLSHLASSDVQIITGASGSQAGNIHINTPINYIAVTSRTLTLVAGNDINVNSPVGSSTGLTVVFNGAGTGGSISGGMSGNCNMVVGSGTMTLTSANTCTGTTTLSSGSTLIVGTGGTISGSSITATSGGTLGMNGGTISVGSINLNGGILTVTSDTDLSSSSVLGLTGGEVINVNGGSTLVLPAFSTVGTMTFSGGGIRQCAGLTIPTGSELMINSGTISGSAITVSGTLNLNGGTISGSTITVTGGTLNLNGGTITGSTINLFGGTLAVARTTDLSSSVVSQTGSAAIQVAAGQTLSLPAFSTSGTLVVQGPGNLVCAGAGITINSGGTLKIQSGSVSGPVTINSGGTLEIQSGSVSGPVTINSGGTLKMYGGSCSSVVLAGGTLVSTITTSVAAFSSSNGGTIQVAAGQTLSLPAFSTNSGTLVVQGAGTLSCAGAGITINSGGILETQNGIVIGTVTINSGGTLKLNGGNCSSIVLAGGTLVSTVSTVVTAFTSSSGGTIQVASGQTLSLPAFSTSSGTLVFEGPGTLSCAGSGITISPGGTLDVTGGTITGNIIDYGSLIFDSSSSITAFSAISGTGILTQNGLGTVTLAGTNTYTGATTVNAGTLSFAAVPSSDTWNLAFNSPASYGQLVLPAAPDLAGKTVNVNIASTPGPYTSQLVSWTGTATGSPALQINSVPVSSGEYVSHNALTYSTTGGVTVDRPAEPAVTGIAPAAGLLAGGTTVTISGSDLSGATAVSFGSTAATSFTVVSATSVTATSPAGTGTVDITVTTPGGTSSASAADQFTYIAPPELDVSEGYSGTFTQGATGGTLTITVSNTAASSAVTSGTTTVTETLPAGFTASSVSGTGWTCSGTTTVTCTGTQAVTGGASFNAISIVVDVPAAALNPTTTNAATASGGGAAASAISGTVSIPVVQVPAGLTAGSGTTPQSAPVNTAFGTDLSVTVTDAAGNPVPGVSVTFSSPGSGASGTFSNSANAITVTTDSSGVATAGSFTANSVVGGPYTVTATAGGLTPADFSLTNTAVPVTTIPTTAPVTTIPTTVPVTTAMTRISTTLSEDNDDGFPSVTSTISQADTLPLMTVTVNIGGDSKAWQAIVTGTKLSDLIVTGTVQSGAGGNFTAPPGIIFQYLSLVPARYASITKAVIHFTVPQAWLDENHIAPGSIVLYHQTADGWEALPTTVVSTKDGTVYFSAESTGFSLFAIAGTPTAATPAMTTVATFGSAGGEQATTRAIVTKAPVTTKTTAPPAATTKPAAPSPLLNIVLVIAAIGVLAGSGFMARRWWIRRQNPALFEDS